MSKKDEINKKLCKNCAKCCKYIALEIDKPTNQKEYDQIRWFLLHKNISIFIDDNKWYIYISNTTCKNLTKNGLCKDYQNRPQICRDYDQSNCDKENNEIFYDIIFKDEKDFLKWLKKNNKKVKTHKIFK